MIQIICDLCDHIIEDRAIGDYMEYSVPGHTIEINDYANDYCHACMVKIVSNGDLQIKNRPSKAAEKVRLEVSYAELAEKERQPERKANDG